MARTVTSRWLLRAGALLLLVTASTPPAARAHDPSTWGGIYRSRDGGASWFLANEGRFVTAALALAIDPTDSSHLLLATDSGLLRSRNGGRDWEVEGQDALAGTVYAVAFDADGRRALAAGGSGLATWDGGDGATWRPREAPLGAAPARLIVPGRSAGRAYLVGWSGLFRSDDWGASWSTLGGAEDLPTGRVTALVVTREPPETVLAVASGALWTRADTSDSWQPLGNGLPVGSLDTVAVDPHRPGRLWAAGADRLFRSDDRGRSWQPVGNPLSESDTAIRGIGVAPSEAAIVLTTDRGLFRSGDGGETWELMVENVPAHLEARPLVHDPGDPMTVYAGFSITPYEGLWQGAVDGRSALARLDPVDLAGGLAFILLLGLAAGWALRRLGRYYGPADHARPLGEGTPP
jgi:photosystem II stability/assembly factor-like uncharacterized protein